MRIIAGKAKGISLQSPDFDGTRPSLDRVKEAMFGSVQFQIPGSTVLDLFSGSGALGLEAASRGANHVYLNDVNPKSIKCIKDNIIKTKLENITVTQYDYKEALQHYSDNGIQFQIILIDAPYKTEYATDSLEYIAKFNLISSNGYIIVEHDYGHPPRLDTNSEYTIRKQKKMGTCAYTILESRKSSI